MSLLERKNWWLWLIIYLFGQGVGIYLLGYFTKVFNKDSWYAKWQYWLIAGLCCIFPIFIMFAVFTLQIKVEVAKKLDVPGHEIYASVYTWILCLVIPIFGWIGLMVMSFYLDIACIIALYRGNGEKYLEN